MSANCAACGATPLDHHLRVRQTAVPRDLAPTIDRFGSALADIERCRACGHMQLARIPEHRALLDAYGEAESEDYVAEEAGQRETARAALELIERHVAPGPLLDVGCWVGFLLAEARGRGWEPLGVEPSEFASRYARELLGLDVMTADLFEADLPERRFHAVVMADVIEHLPQPGDALERVRRLLAPGGVLYLALPDAGSRVARVLGSRWWSVIPTHVQYFTRASTTALLERHGFRVGEMRTAPKSFTVRYYLGRIGGYSPPLGRGLVRAAQATRLADRIWTPDFRDRMCLVARPL